MPRPPKPGPFIGSGRVIAEWMKQKGKSRKDVASDAGVEIASVGHWLTGKSWPRAVEHRALLAVEGLDMTALSREVCKVLKLDPVSPQDRRLLDAAASDPFLRARIERLVSEWETKRKR